MKYLRLTAVILAVFILTINFNSCKSYPPSFETADFYDTNNQVNFDDTDSFVSITPKTKTESAIIFYPGGLVDYHAYLPLMTLCAEKGLACYIVKMPCNFAFMNKRAAGKIIKKYPEIKNWYLAGHSLGGAMAASYLAGHTKDFKGLILLASFSTHNISDYGVNVLSLYGSNDKVLNMDNYKKNLKKLPPYGNGFSEIILYGGNHAQFANYGQQKGDGLAEISAKEQQNQTATHIVQWINEISKAGL